MSDRRALFLTTVSWVSPFRVGSHHIASALASRGWKVAYLSSPLSPIHALGGITPELKRRMTNSIMGWQQDSQHRGLSHWVPLSVVTPQNRPLLKSEVVLKNWWRMCFRDPLRSLKQIGFNEVDLCYIDNPYYQPILKYLRYRHSVMRVADRISAFPYYTTGVSSAERKIAGQVDLVAYTARNLEEYVNALAPRRAFHLPNGVEFEHFARTACSPQEFANIPRPIAIYVGALEHWFDFRLVEAAAAARPNISFVLVGPERLAKLRLRKLPNIHILGPKPYGRLPEFLQHADVGLIPFDVDGNRDLIEGVNPLKLYEYLASGLPVVSADWGEVRRISSPALLYKGVESFLRALEDALQAKDSCSELISFARQAAWSRRVENLLAEFDLL